MELENLKNELVGGWKSIATEVRPSTFLDPDQSLRPLYLTRSFHYSMDDHFDLKIRTYADPLGKLSLAQIDISGTMLWRGPHPIAAGAQKVDFVASKRFHVTPLIPAFAEALNRIANDTFEPWTVGESQSVMRKKFVPFGLTEGSVFKEFDLVFLSHNMLFWGARHVDGRGFDKEGNRPINLQVPMIRAPREDR
jgi:hypothetical protein